MDCPWFEFNKINVDYAHRAVSSVQILWSLYNQREKMEAEVSG